MKSIPSTKSQSYTYEYLELSAGSSCLSMRWAKLIINQQYNFFLQQVIIALLQWQLILLPSYFSQSTERWDFKYRKIF